MRNVLCLLLIFCSGCGLFRNATKTKEEQESSFSSSSDLKTLSEHKEQVNTNMLTFRRDSAGHVYTVQLWPLGNFTYSPVTGFQGQAERIEISAESVHSSFAAAKAESSESNSNKTEVRQKQKAQNLDKKENSTTVTSPSWKWILICVGVAVSAAVIAFFLKKR